MLSILAALFQFVLCACDPHQACAIVHRDPGVAGTYYLYCSQTVGDVEVITVGDFEPDVPSARAHREVLPR